MQAQLQVQGAILLDVVTRQQPALLEFLACETLLVWRDAVLVLDPCFHVARQRLPYAMRAFLRLAQDGPRHLTQEHDLSLEPMLEPVVMMMMMMMMFFFIHSCSDGVNDKSHRVQRWSVTARQREQIPC